MRWRKQELRVLDFDVETIAAGFGDPEWVPNKITCCAWSWVGEDEVHSTICSANALYGPHSKQRKLMLIPLLKAIGEADILTGHNIARFDLPVINSECMRLGLEPIRSALIQDTMKLLRSKGFKKGQDNLGELLKTEGQKLGLNWQQWEDAYAEKGWPVVRERACSDVAMHKEIRERLAELGYLRPPVMWHG